VGVYIYIDIDTSTMLNRYMGRILEFEEGKKRRRRRGE